MGLENGIKQEEKPKWLLELENRKQKHRLLAHEIGAGAACIKCLSNCPGLDLHFWRKICKNCKCSRDDHDVPNDEFLQFDLLFGPSKRTKRKMVVLKLDKKEKHEAETFEWTPPETTEELAIDYMKALPKEKLPIKGSTGAALRKTQLNKQLPLHDFDHQACDELSESERKQFERYVENLKKYVGQGKVSKISGPKPFDKSFMTPANASECFSPKHRYPATGQPPHLRTPGSFVRKNSPSSQQYHHDEFNISQDGNNLVGYPSRAESRQEVLHNPMYGEVSEEASKLLQYHHVVEHERNGSSLAESTSLPSSCEYSKIGRQMDKNSQCHNDVFNGKRDSEIANSSLVPGSREYSMLNPDIGENSQHQHIYENIGHHYNTTNSKLVPGLKEYPMYNQEIRGNANHHYNHENLGNNLQNSNSISSLTRYSQTDPQNKNNSQSSHILPGVKINQHLENSSSVPHSQRYLAMNQKIGQNSLDPHNGAHQENNTTQTCSGSRGHSPNLEDFKSVEAQKFHSKFPGGHSAFSENSKQSLNPAVNFIKSNLHRATNDDISGHSETSNSLPYSHQFQRIGSPKPGESFSQQIPVKSHEWSNQIGVSREIDSHIDKRLNSIRANEISDVLSPPSATYSDEIINSALIEKGLSRNQGNPSFSKNQNEINQNNLHRVNSPQISEKNRQLYNQKPIQTIVENYTDVHPNLIHSEHLNNPVFPEEVVGSTKIIQNPAGVEFLGQAIQDLSMNRDNVQNCHECKEAILVGDVVVTAERAKDSAWHPGCFVCSVCDELLVDLVYFYYKGKLYCGRDLAGLLNIPRCFACDELIFVAEYTVAEGHNYHVKHFCCWDCDLPLAGQLYISENDRPLCLPCYQKNYAKTCKTCERVIAADQQGVAVKNLDFHATDECFCCGNCKKSLLNHRMAVKENKPFCSNECIKIFSNNQLK